MRGGTTRKCPTTHRGGPTKQACPFRPTVGGLESAHLLRRTGSKGLWTQLSPMLLASEPIPGRRGGLQFSDRAYRPMDWPVHFSCGGSWRIAMSSSRLNLVLLVLFGVTLPLSVVLSTHLALIDRGDAG